MRMASCRPILAVELDDRRALIGRFRKNLHLAAAAEATEAFARARRDEAGDFCQPLDAAEGLQIFVENLSADGSPGIDCRDDLVGLPGVGSPYTVSIVGMVTGISRPRWHVQQVTT